MNWTVATARQRFSELLREAAKEPQRIMNRNREVAAVVGGEDLERFTEWLERQRTESIAEAFDLLRQACAEDGYTLIVHRRRDRPNPFARPPR